MKDGTPSSGDDLLGMEIDFDALLGELDELDADTVHVRRTEHAERLITATCSVAPGVSLTAAVAAVRDLWTTRLRYQYIEANDVRVTDDSATLDFITQMGPGRLYVTGQVAISAR
jgi:hypothetical protein